MEFTRKARLKECWEKIGKAPIGVKWVDVHKVYAERPDYRCRLVAKEIGHDDGEDVFVAMPPLEAKKILS